jgi:hypothetical protein
MPAFGTPLAGLTRVTVPASVWALNRRTATAPLATYAMYSALANPDVIKDVQKR